MSLKNCTIEDGVYVFSPSWDEFKDFNKFVSYMEDIGAHHVGLAKVAILTINFTINYSAKNRFVRIV